MPLDTSPYDALLLVSFGGPEKPDDVVPFLENVTRGRGIPRERLEEVGEHYFTFGGRSPINDQNRVFIAAVEEDFRSTGIDVPVYWGNRNWHPFLADTLRQMRDDGVRRAACLVTMVDATLSALADLGDAARRDAHVLFVTHSVPESMNATSGPDGGAYVAQHRAVVEEVGERVRQETGHRYPTELVFCSRSGPPHVPWLEPDVNDRIEELGRHGVAGVVVVPIGFVSDHMEVIYDLDTEAGATAEKLGVEFARAATAGVDPRFVAMVRDLLL